MTIRAGGAKPQRAEPKDMVTTQRIMKIAIEAFDDEDKAWRWLHEPNIQIGNKLPIDVIETPEGFTVVQTILQQIQYAVIG